MRILLITSEWPVDEKAYAGNFVKRLADFLRRAGVDVEVFHFRGRKNPLLYLLAWARVRPKLDPQQFDLVHAHFGQSGLLALPRRLPLVVTFHGTDVLGFKRDASGSYLRYGKILNRVSRFVAARADALIVVSDQMRRYLPAKKPIRVIPTGIDLEIFTPVPKKEARARLGLPQDERLVLFAGDPSSPIKRGTLAKRAVETVNSSLSSRLLVAWGVPHKEMPLYMSAADVIVLTSRHEGSPNVIKEALACNLPVVSVDVGSVAKLIAGIDGCHLCKDHLPGTIARALEDVLRRNQRIKGRDAVRHLSEPITTQKVIEVYNSVTGSSDHRLPGIMSSVSASNMKTPIPKSTNSDAPRLCMLTQYFPPEMGAPQGRLSELGEKLIARGWQVEVLTALPNYPMGTVFKTYNADKPCVEAFGEIRVVRVPLYTAQKGFFKRLRCYFSFVASAKRYGPELCSKPDLLFVESPPLFIGYAARFLSKRWGCPYVFNVSDLWPESAIRLGLLRPGLLTWLAERLELKLYRQAAGVTGQTWGLIESVKTRCPVVPTKVITNGVDPAHFGKHVADSAARKLLGDEPGPVFIFAGLFGYAQGLDQILDLAKALPEEVPGRFVLVGEGHERARLVQRIAEESIPRVKIVALQPRDRVAALLAAADAAVIPLSHSIPETVPAKFYEALGSSLPILLVADGESVHRLEEVGAGLAVRIGDPGGLRDAFCRLATDADLRRRFGKSGRRAAETIYSRDVIAGQLDEFLRRMLPPERKGDAAARSQSVYRSYDASEDVQAKWSYTNAGNRAMVRERFRLLENMLRSATFPSPAECQILDVGCGTGQVVEWFERWGASPDHLYGVDLLRERMEEARRLYPGYHFAHANAEQLGFKDATFDLVLLFTVFSSILNKGMAENTAREVSRVVKPGGAVVWYDLRYSNPTNANVRGMNRSAIRALFPSFQIHLRSVTLLPPLARRLDVGTDRLYPILTRIPCLRGHYLGLLIKPASGG